MGTKFPFAYFWLDNRNMSQQNIPQKFFLCLSVFRRKKNFNEQFSDTIGGKKKNNFLTWFRHPMFTSFDMFTFDSPKASFHFYRNDLSRLNGPGKWQQRQITWWKLVKLFTKVLKQLGTISLRAGNKINGILANLLAPIQLFLWWSTALVPL